MLIGFSIGSYFYPGDGGSIGLVVAILIWLVMSITAYIGGDSIFLSMSGAKAITRDINPRLYNVIEEMKIAAGLPVMPKVYIIDDDAMNAFAVGRNPADCSIAVTAGLVSRLDRDELQGVIAHEISHIINRDALFMEFAGVTLGAITLLTGIFWHTGRYGGMRYRFRSSRGSGGAAQLIIPLLAIIFIIISAIMARLLYFAISRRREYLADASAVRLTRYPEGLASALDRISTDTVPLLSVNKVSAPLFIVNPIGGESPSRFNWQSTHPPIIERIKILRRMSMGAGYSEYQDAYSNIKGQDSIIIPRSALSDKVSVPIRQKGPSGVFVKEQKDSQRELGDLLMTVNQYLFLNCTCGLKIKVPPDYNKAMIACPLCGKEYPIPQKPPAK
jgi:heat shock protein HtpX